MGRNVLLCIDSAVDVRVNILARPTYGIYLSDRMTFLVFCPVHDIFGNLVDTADLLKLSNREVWRIARAVNESSLTLITKRPLRTVPSARC